MLVTMVLVHSCYTWLYYCICLGSGFFGGKFCLYKKLSKLVAAWSLLCLQLVSVVWVWLLFAHFVLCASQWWCSVWPYVDQVQFVISLLCTNITFSHSRWPLIDLDSFCDLLIGTSLPRHTQKLDDHLHKMIIFSCSAYRRWFYFLETQPFFN